MELRVLAVGDVVGEGGLDILSRRLPGLKEETGAHFAVVNGENASGVGITPAQARRILEAGGRRDHPGQPHLEPHPDRGLPGQGAPHPPPGQLRRPGARPGHGHLPPAGDSGSPSST